MENESHLDVKLTKTPDQNSLLFFNGDFYWISNPREAVHFAKFTEKQSCDRMV